MTPKIVNREEKRREIVEAALVLFAQKGVTRTTIQEIADAAGIGKGTVYEYFKSKDDILAMSFDYIREESDRLIAEKLQNVTDPVEKLKLTVDGFLSSFQTLPENTWEILLVFWAEGILNSPRESLGGEEAAFDLRSMYEEYNEFVASLLQEGIEVGIYRQDIDSYTLASSLIGLLDGLMLQQVLLKERININKSARQLIDVFLRGIKVSKESE